MELLEIDDGITVYMDHLKELVNTLEFETLETFKLSELTDNLAIGKPEYCGLYFFEIKNSGKYTEYQKWLNQFIKLWNKKKYYGKSTPKLYKGRYNKHKTLEEWIPLYIGKSQEVGKRINEHIFKELDKRTYAMKLKARKNLADEVFRVSTIEINVTNYDTIVPVIESALRDKWNPIVGKQ